VAVKSTLNKVETLHTEKRSLAYIDQVRLSGRPLTIRGWKELGCEMEVHWRSRIGDLTCGIETRDESSCRDRQKCEQQGIHVTDNHGQYVQEKKKGAMTMTKSVWAQHQDLISAEDADSAY
jgi:hypothetical protein